MTFGIKPYAAMKSSGVEWLGEIPAHWDVRRLKYVLQAHDALSVDGSEKLLSVSQYTGVTERKLSDDSQEPDTRAESLAGYKRANPNDLVVNIMLAWNGSMGVSRFDGIVSPAYCVYRFKHGAAPWYFHNLLRSSKYKSRIKSVSTGVVESRLRLYTDDLYRIESPFPPLSEQTVIACYLNYAGRHIDRYIQAKQKLIVLLEEQKRVLIQETVTGRFDVRTSRPYPVYKGSGMKWLGVVPGHWQVRRLKTLCLRSALYGANVASALYAAGGVRFLRTTDINEDGTLDYQGVYLPDEMVRDYLLTDGDILVSRSGTVGRSFLYEQRIHGPCAYAGYLVRFVPSSAVIPKYIFQFTKTFSFAGFLRTMAISSTISNVNGEKYANCSLPLPPLPEQTAIVRFFDEKTSEIDKAITRAQREIELLREYHQRLINDVVTGKFDVREVAAKLPSEADDSAPTNFPDKIPGNETPHDGIESDASSATL